MEGWHRRINSKKKAKSQLPFYMLITLLHNEAVWLTVQVNLLSANNLKTYQRKKYRQMQGKIFALWERYEEENITTCSFLSRAAHLYRPTVSGMNQKSKPILTYTCKFFYIDSMCFSLSIKIYGILMTFFSHKSILI